MSDLSDSNDNDSTPESGVEGTNDRNERDDSVTKAASQSDGATTDLVGSIAETPILSSEQDDQIRSILATLPRPVMPPSVAASLNEALAAESASRIAASTAPPVRDDLAQRRSRSRRWLATGGGVAAAGALALVVGTQVTSETAITAGPAFATSFPITMSKVHYDAGGLAAQASSQVPRWKAASGSVATTVTAPPPDAPLSPAASVSASTMAQSQTPVAAESPSVTTNGVNAAMRDKLAGCIQKVSDKTPLSVDIATYTSPVDGTDQQVAVVALPAEQDKVDVYLMGVACTTSDTQVKAHITVNSPSASAAVDATPSP